MKIYTIGHSSHSPETFVKMLKDNNIEVLADIRSYPGSKHVPHFNKENMSAWLYESGIHYIHIPKLGGLRSDQHIKSPNTGWINPSFKNYADYQLGIEFKEGLRDLVQIATQYRTAYMCREIHHYHCHRWIVSDVLTAKGVEVIHIEKKASNHAHHIHDIAKIAGDSLIYPSKQLNLFDFI